MSETGHCFKLSISYISSFFQYYIVFVLADGGTDLESFALVDYNEARSLLVQVCTMHFLRVYL
jgi:2-hydroxy-3-keto-5-methylthiopentenyl-1-phosphate phosphatase